MSESPSKADLWAEIKAAGLEPNVSYQKATIELLQEIVNRLRLAQSKEQVSQSEAPRDIQAGLDAYKDAYDETPIRKDSANRIWFREEVKKPAIPQPRARRKLTYVDTGTKTETVSTGGYVETVEVAGDRIETGEVKITMPSYQVGIYLDPKLPFRVHAYNNVRGFDLFEVQAFYGGADLVPSTIKRMYVGNDLCYDIRSVIREIEAEDRRNQLKGTQA